MQRRVSQFAWGVLLYNVAVILWGAYVRATGSGAGCGQHWPLCGGTVLPRSPRLETLIEFSHRASSGLSLVLVIALAVAVFRGFPRGHLARRGAGWSVGFIFSEALVGAGLVLLRLVEHDQSVTRVVSLGLHLTNTFLLLAALSATVYWSRLERPQFGWRTSLDPRWHLGAFVGCIVVGITGAIAALGDTLFPGSSLAEGIQQDFAGTGHLLLRLRVLHPALAVCLALFLWIYGERANVRGTRRLQACVGLQLILGVSNLVLLAPVWMQLVHLAAADALWISVVWVMLESLSAKAEPT